jgi:amino acid adenylation domain-containing protein/non-ribosomal peptide synthase protein (TIGR01720 family)
MDRRIAVIGMAGRFPHASNLTEFYNNLQQSKCSIGEISAERVRLTTLDPGQSFHRRGYMEDVDKFDYQFFNIPYGEAIHMDPHQRLLLEVVAEAMENCGYCPDDFNNTNTAVYVANRNLQYYQHAEQFDPTLITGNASEFLAARINRVFNLTGSVAVIDTSCSSGLVALHNACNELRLGQADQALVCGVNLELFPQKDGQYHIEVDSPDGFSVPFSAASNGMVYGEAVICVVLKPLLKALLDKDHVQAVITGSAVNNNAARAASLTAPDSIAQSEVLRKAWAQAGVQPMQISFIEAHGSGTQLGDSLEIAGMNMAVDFFPEHGQQIPIATVKSNIGHTRSVAGLAGFVKTVLSIKNKMLLPSLSSDQPNIYLQQSASRVRLQEKPAAWDESKGKMVAGVSSIGFSGTNCHVVVEQTPPQGLNGQLPHRPIAHVCLFSSWKENELVQYARNTAQSLEAKAYGLQDIAFTLGKGRKHYEYRKAFVATDTLDLQSQINSWLRANPAIAPVAGPKLIYIFSAGELVTYEMVTACCRQDRYFDERYQHYLGKVSLGIERMAGNIFRFIFQLAYYDFLQYHGIETTSLMGIGIGQVITRVVRKELSVEEGLKKIYETPPARDADAGLQERVERMLQTQAAGPSVVFVDMGMGSNIYPLLKQHPQNGKSFFMHALPTVLPVEDIVNLQALLYERNYASPEKFLVHRYGKRIELPAHPFAKTRCWIREEPKLKSNASVQEAHDNKSSETHAPTGSVYALVAGLWKEVLGIAATRPNLNFFEGGGDSIKATKVIQQLNHAFSIRLDFEDMFDYPTLEAFASFLASNLGDEQKLLLIWKDVLGPALKAEDNFFEKGGHSLLANQILNRMKAEMKLKLDFEDFFLHPSVALMSAFLKTRVQPEADDIIPVAAPAESYPVSHLQRRLWILSQLEEGSVAYNEFNAYKLEGHVNVEALQKAVEAIIRRHESLRTIFRDTAEGPRQVVLPYSPAFALKYQDLTASALSHEAMVQEVREFAKTPFVLSQGPLASTRLLKLEPSRFVFLFNIHHIIFDEWSNQVFIRELVQLYTSFCEGHAPALQPLRIHYKDYADWLSNPRGQQMQEDEKYWLGQLGEGVPVLELPTDLPRPHFKTYNGSVISETLPVSCLKTIEALSVQHGASHFMTLTAIINLLLSRYSGQDTIVMGTPVAGRKDVEMESGIGFYANTIILKTQVDAQQPFASLIASVKQGVVGAYGHQMYPFDLLVEKLGIKTDRSRLPLFDVMIGYQKSMRPATASFDMHGVKVSGFGQPRETSKFDLHFQFMEDASAMSLNITYNTDLYLPATIRRMIAHFSRLVEELSVQPALPVGHINYLLPHEQQPNIPSAAVTVQPGTLYDSFIKEAGLFQSAIAVSTDARSITYEMLLKNADKPMASGNTADPIERITRLIASAKNIDDAHICHYISWFKDHVHVQPGDRYWVNPTQNTRWVEQTWAAVFCGLELVCPQETSFSAATVDAFAAARMNGLVLTSAELQLLARHELLEKCNTSLQWIVLDDAAPVTQLKESMEQAGIQLAVLYRQEPGVPALAELSLSASSLQLKQAMPGITLKLSDRNGLPVPPGISANLLMETPGEWKHTGIAASYNEQGMITCSHAGHELLHILLAKDNTGQVAIIDHTIMVTPAGPGMRMQNESRPAISLPELQQAADDRDLALLASFNATETELPRLTVVDYIRQWAMQAPNATAVVCMERSLTYQQLNEASDRMAQQLLSRKIEEEEIIPVYASRSIEFLVTIIAIFKAGATYLPLSVDAPCGRICEIIKDCGARYMLVSRHDLSERFTEKETAQLAGLLQEMPDIHALLQAAPVDVPVDFPPSSFNALAYIIYTSGSTGRPKGVMIEHCGMMNHIQAKIRLLQIDTQTRMVQNAPQSFDISIWQFMTALVAGGQTLIYPNALVEDPEAFANKLAEDRPEIVEVVPSYLNVLLDVLESNTKYQQWQARYLVLTAEASSPRLVTRWFGLYPAVTLVNAYGPTEASDNITHHVFSSLDKSVQRLPIGKPVDNMKIYIADAAMNLCPIGVAGEICVAGTGVGRGYINQPEKTSEVFLDNPWQPGQRMYMTGDLGYFNNEGVVEFLGRKDHQIKIHGHRIETAEIEHCLCQLEGVRNAIVLPFKSADGNDFLSAYLLMATDHKPETQDIKQYLKDLLPPYMVPAHIFFRTEFPLTPNGKINRKAFSNPELFRRKTAMETDIKKFLSSKLPEYRIPGRIIAIDHLPLTQTGEPDWSILETVLEVSGHAESAPPVTPAEKQLAAIWQQVMGIDKLGIDDDFFEKGGHSLTGMRLLAAIENKFGKRLSLRHLFASPTVRKLALELEAATGEALQIPRQPEKAYYPVSFAQRRMWVMTRLSSAGYAYNICGALHLAGPLDKEAWEQSWLLLVRRHEVLRTNFTLHEGEVCQSVLPFNSKQYSIAQVDISSHAQPHSKLEGIYREHEQAVFDLEKGPLLRGSMISCGRHEHVFMYTMHHIISDEWSLDLLSRELLQAYQSHLANTAPRLDASVMQYRDYACWQRDESLQHWQQSRQYWLDKLSGSLPVMDLPIDNRRPAVKTYAGGTEMAMVPRLAEQLHAAAGEGGATLFMALLASVKIFLYRYCQQEDIIIGTPVSGRNHAVLQGGAGFYLNTLALRTLLKKDDSFHDVLRKVKRTTVDAFGHQDYPFDKLVEELEVKRNLSRSALFDVMLVLHDESAMEGGKVKMGALEVKPYSIASTASKYDLSFHFRRQGDSLEIGLNYNTDLFSQERAQLLLQHFRQLLAQLHASPFSPIHALDYLHEDEKLALAGQDTTTSRPLLHDNLEDHIRNEWPGLTKTALADVSGSLDYNGLQEASARMASYLQVVHGVQPGNVVGLCMERSIGLIISMLGIIRAGASYLPMDKSFPQQRLDFMLADSKAVLVISDDAFAGTLPSVQWNGTFYQQLQEYTVMPGPAVRGPLSIAYIIYTSGTSGQPKGVQVTDHALLNYASGIDEAYGLQGQELRGLLASSIAFDLGYTCLWGMLLLGGELYLLPQQQFWQPREAAEWIEARKINFIKLTPSHFRLLAHEFAQQPGLNGSHLQWIILGGEKLLGRDIEQWLEKYPHCCIANHYGPTETTIGVLTHRIDAGNIAAFAKQPVIGLPMGGHKARIVDVHGNLCATGIWGELWIEGAGVSPGYINGNGLNAKKFMDSPFSANKKLYKTGDRCRRLLNGQIEFGGRMDAQVQVKGYRVEPEEIEQVMMQHPEVALAAVTVQVHNEEEALVAFVVTVQPYMVLDKEALKLYMGTRLPAYMVPLQILQADSLPLKGNGKIDRANLPTAMPDPVSTESPEQAARNKAEEDLLSAFSAVMPAKQVNIRSSFFELGGDSIKAIQVASRLYRMGWKLDVKDVFDHPVLEEMALRMQVIKQLADQSAVKGEVPLGPIQLDFFNRQFNFEHHYNQSILLRSEERFDAGGFLHIIKKILEHHDALRMVYLYEGKTVKQYNRGIEIETEVFDIDLRQVEDPVQELAHQAQNLHESFDLEQGPLLKAAIFRMPDNDRLFLVAHHLVVDGVSWRILLEDINTLWQQSAAGRDLKLPPKTESFRKWTERIQLYAGSDKFLQEQSYWYNWQQEAQQPLWPTARGSRKDIIMNGFELDEGNTELLLTSVPQAYQAEINDVFLAALSASLAEVCIREKIWIAMEGHGREGLVDVDISRTVGWFTCMYPVGLDASRRLLVASHIRHTRDQLRRVPQKGAGYGLVKYLSDRHTYAKDIDPEVVFNYLGQFDSDIGSTTFSFANEQSGHTSNPDERVMYPLAITGRILNGRLRMNFEFDGLSVPADQRAAICKAFETHLLQAIVQCSEETIITASPVSFQYKEISQETLESLFD